MISPTYDFPNMLTLPFGFPRRINWVMTVRGSPRSYLYTAVLPRTVFITSPCADLFQHATDALSFVKVMTMPPAMVSIPLARWEGSWDLRDMPICRIPKPSRMIPTGPDEGENKLRQVVDNSQRIVRRERGGGEAEAKDDYKRKWRICDRPGYWSYGSFSR